MRNSVEERSLQRELGKGTQQANVATAWRMLTAQEPIEKIAASGKQTRIPCHACGSQRLALPLLQREHFYEFSERLPISIFIFIYFLHCDIILCKFHKAVVVTYFEIFF